MLDMIETALRTNGFLFQRIDGQKSLEQRIRALDAFNNDPTCTVMLASIGSVAEGYVTPSFSQGTVIVCLLVLAIT